MFLGNGSCRLFLFETRNSFFHFFDIHAQRLVLLLQAINVIFERFNEIAPFSPRIGGRLAPRWMPQGLSDAEQMLRLSPRTLAIPRHSFSFRRSSITFSGALGEGFSRAAEERHLPDPGEATGWLFGHARGFE